MNLTPHFTVAAFIFSETAARRGIDNSLPASLLGAAVETSQMLERIRERLSHVRGVDVPLYVTSGYRCLPLNRAIGSSDSSDHVRALAADFKAPAFGTAFEVAQALALRAQDLEIGQLIHEFGSWVHVSTRRPTNSVNRIITITSRGTEVGIQEVA